MTPTPEALPPDLRTAAQRVLDRWDSPRWKWNDGPTADLMADLRAALAAQKWQPIESAPDGVMLLFADMRADEARWWVFCGWRHCGTKGNLVQMPDNTTRTATHWQPLPQRRR